MGIERTESGHQFLPIGEAAQLLGLSRIRLREAITKGLLSARRDNEGHLRVDLSAVPKDFDSRLAGEKAQPGELLETLFDEIEELQFHVAGRDADIERLTSLLERQDAALERSIELNERGRAATSPNHIATDGSDRALADVSERAFVLLDDVADRLETAMAQNDKFRQLLERALYLSERAASGSGDKIEELSGAVERALNLLDRSLQQGESKSEAATRLTELLDRALTTSQQMEQQVQNKVEVISRQEETVEKLLGISERAVGLAGSAQPRRWRWLNWFTGRRMNSGN
jgi:DNA repair exonuclease SbcCD ATPase subunit